MTVVELFLAGWRLAARRTQSTQRLPAPTLGRSGELNRPIPLLTNGGDLDLPASATARDDPGLRAGWLSHSCRQPSPVTLVVSRVSDVFKSTPLSSAKIVAPA